MQAKFYLFIVLQLLDLFTTLWFIHHGGAEGNPIVIYLAGYAPSFEFGLIAIKLWALGLGYAMFRYCREWFLDLTNGVFALVVAWNLFNILLTYFR